MAKEIQAQATINQSDVVPDGLLAQLLAKVVLPEKIEPRLPNGDFGGPCHFVKGSDGIVRTQEGVAVDPEVRKREKADERAELRAKLAALGDEEEASNPLLSE
jgi:hypothetical protein